MKTRLAVPRVAKIVRLAAVLILSPAAKKKS